MVLSSLKEWRFIMSGLLDHVKQGITPQLLFACKFGLEWFQVQFDRLYVWTNSNEETIVDILILVDKIVGEIFSFMTFIHQYRWRITITIACLVIVGYYARKATSISTQRMNELKIQELVKCRSEIAKHIVASNCNPIMLRLAWCDAGTFDKTILAWPQCGGANGSIRYDYELSHPANSGLAKAIDILAHFKTKYKSISWADMIQMAGALAVELAHGPQINILYGRLDSPPLLASDETKGESFRRRASQQNMKETHKDSSNQDTEFSANEQVYMCHWQCKANRQPSLGPVYPDGAPSAEIHLRNVFYRMGFDNRDIVALSGAHTLGRGFKDRTGVCEFSTGDQGATCYTRHTSIAKANGESGIGMPGGCSWTKNWLHFDNSYYRQHLASLEGGDTHEPDDFSARYALNNNNTSPFSTTGSTATAPIITATATATATPGISRQDNEGLMASYEASNTLSNLLWLPSDQALYDCPEFRPYFIAYAKDVSIFHRDYVSAHKKMSELGVKFELKYPGGIVLPPFDSKS